MSGDEGEGPKLALSGMLASTTMRHNEVSQGQGKVVTAIFTRLSPLISACLSSRLQMPKLLQAWHSRASAAAFAEMTLMGCRHRV